MHDRHQSGRSALTADLPARIALAAAGGFDFWPELPVEHCGEDVLPSSG